LDGKFIKPANENSSQKVHGPAVRLRAAGRTDPTRIRSVHLQGPQHDQAQDHEAPRSEDGKSYGEFEIGKGIKAGETVELQWDKSTDNGKCKQWFKAVFDDGEESEAEQFDFCEEDLVLEF
jgi:hypothetical protein